MGEPIATVGELAGGCGYDGQDWQKLGFVWGYNDVVSETVDDTNLSAGTNYLNGTVVPAGEVWTVTIAAGRYEGAAGPNLFLSANIGGVVIHFYTKVNPTTTVWYGQTCQVILEEGDKMMGTITGAAAGDTGRFRYAGYKMKLSM